MRIAIGIEYDGGNYVGWQRQKSGTGIQELLENAIAVVANEPVDTICAGRTDAGVHATGQVAHFDTRATRSERGWILGINSNLPDDINVTFAREVDDEFHARFGARSRTYRYLILNRLVRSSLYRNRAWWVREPLDDSLMSEAATHLLGEHDFSAFRAAGCQASSPVRTVMDLEVTRIDDWITIAVTANAFLQHMVRNLSGTLVAIGRGDEQPGWARQVLESRDRKAAGIAAPPHGLFFVSVSYPASFQMPSRNADTPLIKVYDSPL
ncbi:MAG: tRNA pseudouridine(38-40) synthase TruA [Gammaproteobacteria bacterium]|nr:tRNA pseudouridine(38-40) synthase TruA [Gammaproteobacteria bacterium]